MDSGSTAHWDIGNLGRTDNDRLLQPERHYVPIEQLLWTGGVSSQAEQELAAPPGVGMDGSASRQAVTKNMAARSEPPPPPSSSQSAACPGRRRRGCSCITLGAERKKRARGAKFPVDKCPREPGLRFIIF